jgi:hypothetical protein
MLAKWPIIIWRPKSGTRFASICSGSLNTSTIKTFC